MKPSRLLPRLLALCLLAAALPAEAWRLPDEAAARLAAGVPPPPDDASPAGLADLQTVLQVQAARTPEQAAAAASHAVRLPLDLVAPLFGTDLRDKLPRAAAFFSEVHKTGDRVVDRVKDTYRRPRPWQRSDDVQPCVYIPRGFSYPSGHSLNAALWAALWSEILPEYAAFFSAGIPSAMWNRVVGGAHYPSDTQAGALLGGQIAVEILKTPGVRDELAAIRAELDAVLAGQPAAVAA
ncbi:MAG: phosphatase PAP2 family protein, partial [Opitutaceae bacterium]|nr:phosphatase PAP2 family protein [Opitutaceae bacterium]